IFSLGIVLHECLTGQALFHGRSVAETIRRIWGLEPPDPREGRNDVPPGIVPIVRRCLHKERDLRYATAGEVADDLRELLRTNQTAIDEADLGRLLREHFPRHREKMRERIREAIRAADEGRLNVDESGVLPGDDLIPSERGEDSLPRSATELTGSITTGPPLETRKSSTLWLALAAAVAVGLGVWLIRESTDDRVPEPAASDEPTAAAPAPSSAPTPSISASVAPPAASSAAPPRPQVRTPRPAPPPPSPSPSGKSHKGVPFKSVD
ncbi:MAG TPA: hypothetical protein VFB62_26965, partial [Polyangiaceae bacterium]|nr:hypothetical protein [Polyangiaceae bacterium]